MVDRIDIVNIVTGVTGLERVTTTPRAACRRRDSGRAGYRLPCCFPRVAAGNITD